MLHVRWPPSVRGGMIASDVILQIACGGLLDSRESLSHFAFSRPATKGTRAPLTFISSSSEEPADICRQAEARACGAFELRADWAGIRHPAKIRGVRSIPEQEVRQLVRDNENEKQKEKHSCAYRTRWITTGRSRTSPPPRAY